MSGLSGYVFGATKGRLLKTGQTTQRSSESDDGLNQKGMAKAYQYLTTGGYSGTTNIDLAHYTASAGAVAFDNVAKTITDTGNGLAIFKTNDVITTDDVDNPGPFTVTTGNVAGTITCTGATFVTGTPAGAVTIKKREAHSNACTLDLNTGLMWSQTLSTVMGAASDGLLPWTAQLYDIFDYVAAANTAALAGYTDWRIPNIFELMSIADYEAPTAAPDATGFPSWTTAATGVYSSTTTPSSTANRLMVRYDSGAISSGATTVERAVALVRG